MRRALHNMKRYIATSEVSKHRTFVFLDWPEQLVDGSVISVCTSDAAILAVLSSSWHQTWSLAQGGTLEDRPRYHYSHCFDPFPFPDMTTKQADRLSELGEQLDAHRKRQQAAHPKLTMTQMYTGIGLHALTSGFLNTRKRKAEIVDAVS
jgi:hypothetical protein